MDNVSAANASMAAARARASVHAVTCKKCGANRLAWATSKKTGKSYLCETTAGVAGKVIPSPHRPHFKNCGKDTNH